MKISASIYSNPSKSLKNIVKELDVFQIDYLHVDCNDDLSVFDDIAHIRSFSKTPIDLHIITDKPTPYFDPIRKNAIELVAFQHENLPGPLDYPKDLAARLGIAFTSETPVEAFELYAERCSFILFMTTTPGMSGGSFDRATFDRIRDFKKLFPHKQVHVDGGVNDEVSFILRNLGVTCAISGSYLVKSHDLPQALLSLKSDYAGKDYKVRDFMIQPNELPVLSNDEAQDFAAILRGIDRAKLGFTLIVDEDRHLRGVATDGDLRRAVLANVDNLAALKGVDIINRDPIVVQESSSVCDMLKQIASHQRPILFLPVVDTEGVLTGAISFNNLVKGEL